MSPDLGREVAARPDDDAWWRSLAPDLARIETPMLVCGSFSDANLHTRGSFRAFADASSPDRHLFTHRGGKWATFYGEEAKAAQLAFLTTHLKGDPHRLPRVRLEVRERRDDIHEVRHEEHWPPPGTLLQLHLHGDGRLAETPPAEEAGVAFRARRTAARYSWIFEEDTEVSGDATLRLWASAASAGPVSVFAGLSKWTQGRFVPFEGSYGFGRDFVATGFRRTDLDARPRLVEIEFAPSATLFRAGDELRLHVSGRQLSPRNPLWGSFPALYRPSRRVDLTLHSGPAHPQVLELPVAARRNPR